MSKSRIEELYELIQHHADLYYNEDAPEITDAEYDALVRELKALEAANPDAVRADFLTHQVGGQASELFSKVKHAVPILTASLLHQQEEQERQEQHQQHQERQHQHLQQTALLTLESRQLHIAESAL